MTTYNTQACVCDDWEERKNTSVYPNWLTFKQITEKEKGWKGKDETSWRWQLHKQEFKLREYRKHSSMSSKDTPEVDIWRGKEEENEKHISITQNSLRGERERERMKERGKMWWSRKGQRSHCKLAFFSKQEENWKFVHHASNASSKSGTDWLVLY